VVETNEYEGLLARVGTTSAAREVG
jgi:hypothetical protein